MAVRAGDWRGSKCCSVMGQMHTREFDESAYATKQIATAKTVGAVSSEAAEWYAIDWQYSLLHICKLLQITPNNARQSGPDQ